MYQKNKSVISTISLGAITFLAIAVFIIQMRSPIETNLLFLSLFLLTLLTVSELINLKAGVYASVLSIVLLLLQAFTNSEHSEAHFLMSLGYILVSGYYFLIRHFRRKKHEKTSEREKHFRSLVNMSLQPIILKNEKGEVIFASESLKELLGLKKNLPIGKNIAAYIHPEDVHEYDKFLTQIMEWPNIKKTIELRVKKNGESYIWARNDAVNLLKHPGVKAIVSSWQDISFQKTVDFHKSELLRNEQGARAIAEKAVRDRDEFLSIASHELKTPLTSVLLQLQATLRKILTQSLADFSGRDLLQSLQIAEKQSQSLSILIKDLLNVSLASTGRLTLATERVNLAELVKSLSEKYSEEINLSGCSVKTIIKDEEIIGQWDPIRLDQALTNLFMNALKYASGKKIVLTAYKESGVGIFKIKDNGQGIPIELQSHIFEPFKRANGNSAVKGLGVGLFITRQIVVSHGGEINVESKTGEGATFTVKLPLTNSL